MLIASAAEPPVDRLNEPEGVPERTGSVALTITANNLAPSGQIEVPTCGKQMVGMTYLPSHLSPVPAERGRVEFCYDSSFFPLGLLLLNINLACPVPFPPSYHPLPNIFSNTHFCNRKHVWNLRLSPVRSYPLRT